MTAPPHPGTYPGADPYFSPPPPPPLPGAPLESEPLTAREIFVQRLVGGALMVALLSITALLWDIDGAFKILFTVYTAWAGFWLWALFVKRPPI